jgi:hypothetical protein
MNDTPVSYLLHRKFTDPHWSEPHPIYGDATSASGAEERARQLMKLGVAGLKVGRITEWRLVRNGALVHAWRTDGR